MGCPEADGGDGEEDVLAWLDGPGPGKAESNTQGVTGEDFNVSISATAANIAVDEA